MCTQFNVRLWYGKTKYAHKRLELCATLIVGNPRRVSISSSPNPTEAAGKSEHEITLVVRGMAVYGAR